jgi:transposase
MNTFTNSAGLEVRVNSPQRGQVMMHMLSLDEMIRADHPVRNVWRYVCSLDLAAFYQDIQAVKGGVGRDAVDPRILLALWIFATLEGVGSARRLAELCTRDFAYLWICGEVTVNRDLLNSFRSSHPEALDEIMIETIGILLDQGLVSLTRVAPGWDAGPGFRRQKFLSPSVHTRQASGGSPPAGRAAASGRGR